VEGVFGEDSRESTLGGVIEEGFVMLDPVAALGMTLEPPEKNPACHFLS